MEDPIEKFIQTSDAQGIGPEEFNAYLLARLTLAVEQIAMRLASWDVGEGDSSLDIRSREAKDE